jgi:hypothetical protein
VLSPFRYGSLFHTVICFSKFVFYSNEHACCLFRRNINYVQLSLTSFLKFTSKLFSGFNFITNLNLLGEFRDFCWNFYVGWIPLASARTLFSVFTEILSAILIIRPRVAIATRCSMTFLILLIQIINISLAKCWLLQFVVWLVD